ncbi:MAG: ATP-binding protein [Erysipelotrichaceae bacterium]|nr:ATP-binding protein [Erysipelotrichaceae bacterium]
MKRKIELYLLEWKNKKDHLPLVVKGARQIGKTYSIEKFASENYKHLIEINFSTNEAFMNIFEDGYNVDSIIKNISLIMPDAIFESGNTLIFFDEIQLCSKGMTSLKQFKLDGRFDVICSGSLMGINYNEIQLNSVGYKEDYEMHSMDFEEFLWAKGYKSEQINNLLNHIINVKPFSDIEMKVYKNCFYDYLITGGMPAIVQKYIENKNFSGILQMQRQLLNDYEEDITKYAKGLEKGKILNVYRNIPYFLGKESKRYQITKISKSARTRDYIGAFEWLSNAGIINICYCLNSLELPLSGNYDMSKYKIYFGDTGLLIASLDEEAQLDLRENKNFNTFKGAIFESIAGETLVKAGYKLFYFKDDSSQIEMDFFIRGKNSLIPIEIKSKDGSTASLNKLIEKDKYKDIKFGIKFGDRNIGFNGKFYTLPYFTMFLLKDFIKSID